MATEADWQSLLSDVGRWKSNLTHLEFIGVRRTLLSLDLRVALFASRRRYECMDAKGFAPLRHLSTSIDHVLNLNQATARLPQQLPSSLVSLELWNCHFYRDFPGRIIRFQENNLKNNLEALSSAIEGGRFPHLKQLHVDFGSLPLTYIPAALDLVRLQALMAHLGVRFTYFPRDDGSVSGSADR